MLTYNIHVYSFGDVQGQAKDLKSIKAATKEAMLSSGKMYPVAHVKYDGKEAMATLTPKKQIRWEIRSEYVAPAAVVYGEFVEVVSVEGKYCDSMGAFELMTVRDNKSQEYKVDNRYSTETCFRNMDTAARLQYAQESI